MTEKDFSEVLCIRDYKGFRKGVIYAQVGWNNGSHVLKPDEFGYPKSITCSDYEGGYLADIADISESPVFVRCYPNSTDKTYTITIDAEAYRTALAILHLHLSKEKITDCSDAKLVRAIGAFCAASIKSEPKDGKEQE